MRGRIFPSTYLTLNKSQKKGGETMILFLKDTFSSLEEVKALADEYSTAGGEILICDLPHALNFVKRRCVTHIFVGLKVANLKKWFPNAEITIL